jgi:hypothetical protein
MLIAEIGVEVITLLDVCLCSIVAANGADCLCPILCSRQKRGEIFLVPAFMQMSNTPLSSKPRPLRPTTYTIPAGVYGRATVASMIGQTTRVIAAAAR